DPRSGTLGRKFIARPTSAEIVRTRSGCGHRPVPKPASAGEQPRSFRTWQESPSWNLDRVQCFRALPPRRRQQLRRRCFAWPPVTSMTGAPWAKQFLPFPPFVAVVAGSVAVPSPSLKPVTTRIHPIVSSPPTEPQRVVRPPGIGKNVLPVTESAATECAFGCGSLGGLLTGPKLLMPV